MAGDGPERATLQALARDLGIERQVYFLGLVSDMAAFYAGIDVLAHPALREPFGQIVIEASAHGVPSIVAGVDGLVEVVDHGKSGDVVTPVEDLARYAELGSDRRGLPPFVYDPLRDEITAPRIVAPDTLADAIRALLSDDARYAAYSQAGIKRVAVEFDFDTHVERVLKATGRFTQGKSLAWKDVP